MKFGRMTAEEYRCAVGLNDSDRESKYKAKQIDVDGIRFASRLESERYKMLSLLEKSGKLSKLRVQPQYELQPSFTTESGDHVRAIRYIGDFEYVRPDGVIVCEDVKGMDTPVSALKRKLFQFRYPDIALRIIRRADETI